jgi:integrase
VVAVYYLCSAKTKDMDKGNKPNGKGQIKVPEVKFNLKSLQDKNKPTLISAVFRYHNQKLVYSTKHKIKPLHWNAKAQKPKAPYEFYNDVVNDLNVISTAIRTIHTESNGDNLTLSDFKTKLDIKLGRIEIEDCVNEIDFTDYLKTYIRAFEIGNLAQERTAQKYQTLLNNIQEFKPGAIPFNSIDIKFKKEFIEWRYENSKAKSQNTINKDFGCIKNVLKQAYNEGLHTNTIFRDEGFSVKTVKTSIFALSEYEVNKLHEYDFSNNKRLERVRDWFLISCWSALRWSDFSSISPEHIIKDGVDYFLRKKTIKTGELVFIPIDKRLFNMLEKYGFKSIDISNQKFNDYIKEVFEVAGITDNIILDTNYKGVDKEVTKRKCDVVSAHDGRRTWATINYLNGYPIGLLMQVTGHTMESTFLSYVGASPLDKARKLNEMFKNR